MASGRMSGVFTPARFLLLAGALLLTACDSVEERIAKHHARGVELVEAGDDDKAALEFRNALQLDQDHVPSRLEAGKLYERQGDLRAAVGNYRAVTELDAQNVEARVALARLLLAGGLLDEALTFAEQALALAPDDADALAAKAGISIRLGNTDDAVADARRALEIDPDNEAAELILVAERFTAGDLDTALARIDTVLERAPENRAFNVLKLQLLASAGRNEEVVAHLEKLTGLYPDERAFARALAQTRVGTGDMVGADAALRAFAASHPDDTDAALDVVRLARQTGGVDAARVALQEFIDSAATPDDAFPFRLAQVQLDYTADRRDDAKAALRSLIDSAENEENAATARIQLARLLFSEKDIDGAAALIAEVLDADDENVEALAIRANIAIEQYRPADAIADVRRALAGNPQNVQLMLIEARAHERNGSPDLSIERLAAATRTSNFAPNVANFYVRGLLARGEISAAETVLTEVVRRNPGNRAALAQLAELRLRLEDWVGAEEVADALRALEGGGEAAAAQVVAASLSGQGRVEESIQLLENFSETSENGEAAVAGLVANYVRAGQIDRAEAFIDDILSDNPNNVRARLLRAELYVLRGSADQATEELRAVIDIAPQAPIGYVTLARLNLQQGLLDNAAAVAREGIDAVENDQVLRLLVAQIAEIEGDFDHASTEYEALYAQNPESLVAANNLVSLVAEHRYTNEESLALATRVAQRLRGSSSPEIQDTYGWVQFLNGDPEAALRSLAPAADALPNNALVRYHAGRVYAELGQTAEARAHLEAALALDANFPKADSARDALASLGSGETQ